MPVHFLSSSSRRHFLRETIGTLTVLSAAPLTADSDSSDWAFASDCHIDANPATTVQGVNLTENLRSMVTQVLAEPAGTQGLFLDGDCAYLQGLPADYVQLRTLLEPLRQAGLPVHMVLGNHDHRENFRQVFAPAGSEPGPVPGKHVTVIHTPLVNWFLLDSLFQVNKVTGSLGEEQLRWLGTVLDQFRDQPAILLGHHNPQLEPTVGKGGAPHYTGLSDTAAFWALLHRKPQVQAYVFGHTHHWKVAKTEGGVHLVNLPAVAYVFEPSWPSGWVRGRVDGQGLYLELRALNSAHPGHGQKMSLVWR